MKLLKIISLVLIFTISSFASENLQACAQTEVSKTSVIFTCMHGEYYVTYTSTTKKDVESIKILYTKADKYKYFKEENRGK